MAATTSTPPEQAQQLPEVGQAVRVRNRLATVRSVDAYDTRNAQGRMHLVEVEYLDDCRLPEAEKLLWEVEATAQVLGRTSLPAVDANRPDSPAAVKAFVNAHRWTRLNRLREPEHIEDEPLLGVWNSAIQVHAYQAEPVLRALTMPRVSLLLADGVGLGKTIQSGLVLEELLLRRRIRRILVVCPSLLQRQWMYELRRRFNLDFEVIDSDTTFQLRRRLGIDTNPWKAFPRIITSMDYLRMPDVLQQFLQSSGVGLGDGDGRTAVHAPWDLLIVDECHHFAPQSGSRASQRTRMLREIRFLFEHRIFASATPHNGKTVSFTGLLELLDPVRFQMSVEMDGKDRQNLADVRVRRLKEDINKQSIRPPFADQLPPVALPVRLTANELALYSALREYRKHSHAALAAASTAERWVGQFINSLLTKRLLSCPFAFARTWWRHLENGSEDGQTPLFDMARVSAERAEEQTRSDEERSMLEEDAARYSGAWLRSHNKSIESLQHTVNASLERLGYGRSAVENPDKLAALAARSDAKTEALVQWIKQNLFQNGKLRDDERLIVFTEYKETLFYLEQRLLKEGFDKNTLRLLYGGMDAHDFEDVKGDFEDPAAAVRVLLATDAASEGINMQEQCRWIIHYDIPWSPARLMQRNGRVSRYGQDRDVSVHYFQCDEEEDLQFLFFVAGKVEQVRNDLGSVEQVFDAAIQQHFRGRKVSQAQLDLSLEKARSDSTDTADLGASDPQELGRMMKRAQELLESTDSRLGISSPALVEILRTAIAVEGQGALEEIKDRPGFYRLTPPPRWDGLVKQTLSVGPRTDRAELVFDSALIEEENSGRRVMRLKKHQTLMRLGHPVMRQAMAVLCRQLHDPTAGNPIFRWTVAALHKTGFEALLAFHYTLTAINDLREPLHDEVLTQVFRIDGDELTPVPAAFAEDVLHSEFLPIKSSKKRDDWTRTLRIRWPAHRKDLESFLKNQEKNVTASLQTKAQMNLKQEVQAARDSYRYRLDELKDRSREQELTKLAKELLKEKAAAMQPALFEEITEETQVRVGELEDEMAVLRQDVERTRDMLTKERDYRLNTVLPKRFHIREVRVLPLALVYLVPATGEDLQP